jgi:hypothetical protein
MSCKCRRRPGYVKYTDRIFGTAVPAIAATTVSLTADAAVPVYAINRKRPEY